MFRSFALVTLIGLACALGAPSRMVAQTSGDVAPVPGPYQAMPVAPQAVPNPYSNPGFAQNMPYWMRPRAPQGQGNGAAPTPAIAPNFIPGWVWSRNVPGAPNQPGGMGMNGGQIQRMPGGGQIQRMPGGGQWQGMPPMAYGTRPWGQQGYGPGNGPGNRQGMWPNTNSGAPQGYGARMQPNQ